LPPPVGLIVDRRGRGRPAHRPGSARTRSGAASGRPGDGLRRHRAAPFHTRSNQPQPTSQLEPLRVNEVGAGLLPIAAASPLNPKLTDAFGWMTSFHGAFTAVTVLPLWDTVAPQPGSSTVWPAE